MTKSSTVATLALLPLVMVIALGGTLGFRGSRAPASESGCMLKSPEEHYLFHYPQTKNAKGQKPEIDWTRTEADLNDDGTQEIFLTPKTCRSKACLVGIYQKQPDGCYRSIGTVPSQPKVLSASKSGYKLLEVETSQGTVRFHFDTLISEYKPDATVHAP